MDQWATPASAFDLLSSLPFRHELLRALSRAEAAVLSAIIYAARLRAWGEEFALCDARIAEQTGYSTRHIRRVRAALLKLGLFSCRRRAQHGVNYYAVDRAQAERILLMSNESHRERVERILERFPESVRDYAKAFYLATGQIPRRNWKTAIWLIKKCGKRPEWLKRLTYYMQERGYTPKHPGFAVRYAMRDRAKRLRRERFKYILRSDLPIQSKSRRERKARKEVEQARYARKYYRYAYDPASRSYYIAEELPYGATAHVYEDPLPLMMEIGKGG